MKRILMLLLGGILTLSVTAQTITITFNGTTATRNFQVILDGTSYYSNSAIQPNTNTNVRKEITLSNQELGTHSVEIYRLRNNSGTYNNGTNTTPTGRAIYSKDFQLRSGYDMNIAINGNGGVSFTEKRIRNQGRRGGQTVTPMADATFDQLMQTVRSRWSQSTKYAAERDAFYNTANYFTSEQVRQLLLLISSESNRLALAKLAYPRVADPANFTQIYSSVFNTTASRNSMDLFIRNNPNNNKSGGNWGNNSNTNNTYRTPMADYPFSQLLQTVNSQYSQSSKYSTIMGAFNNSANYFTTAQIRQLLSVINSENDRLALAKQSYARVTDASAFTSLYDLFYSQSSRDELNNLINGTTTTNTGSRTAMSNYQFNQLLQNVNSQYNQAGKFNTIANAFNTTGNYFTTAQIRQLLSVINSESDRLALAKQSYARVTDASAFTSLYDLFYSQSSRDELNNLINGNTTTNTGSRTAMANYQFNQLLQSINSQYNQAGKINTITNAFNTTGNYFSTAQIRQLLSLISSESDRLALAKQSFLKVSDPTNFTTLYNLFYSQANRNELNNYVIQNGGSGTTVQTNIRVPVSDALFNQLYQKAKNHIRPSSTLEDLRGFFNNSSYNFTTAQIRMLLSLASNSILPILSSETDILEVAKLSWHRVTDPASFTQIFDLFTSQANRDALNAYILAHPY